MMIELIYTAHEKEVRLTASGVRMGVDRLNAHIRACKAARAWLISEENRTNALDPQRRQPQDEESEKPEGQTAVERGGQRRA